MNCGHSRRCGKKATVFTRVGSVQIPLCDKHAAEAVRRLNLDPVTDFRFMPDHPAKVFEKKRTAKRAT